MKLQIVVITVFAFFQYQCNKQDNSIDSLVNTPVQNDTALYGKWNIESLSIGDSIISIDSSFRVIRKMIIRQDSTVDLFYYDKLTVSDTVRGMLKKYKEVISVPIESPINDESWNYHYVLSDKLKLDVLFGKVYRTYKFIK